MTMSDMVLHGGRLSNQVGETLFHPPELPNAEPHEKAGDAKAEPKARPIKLAFTAEQAPAKSIYDADHRIEGIEKAPPLRNDARAEADRRHVKAQLHNERNNVTK